MDSPCSEPAPDTKVRSVISPKLRLIMMMQYGPTSHLSYTCQTHVISCLQDCETRIKEFFNNKLYIIGYVGIGIAGVMVSQELKTNPHFVCEWGLLFTEDQFSSQQIIGMIFSMVLCCAIRNSREVIWAGPLICTPHPPVASPQKTLHPSEPMSVHHSSREERDLVWYSKRSSPLWCSSTFYNILIIPRPIRYPVGTVSFVTLTWQSVK